jgi:hypothetical protein
MPRICLSKSDLSRPWQGRGRVTGCWQLASLRPLAATTPSSRQFVTRSIPISDAVASVKQSNVCDGQRERLIILVQGHEWLYNLLHRHYDNNLVKGNSWKEIAGLHAQDKELSRRTRHCRRMAWERHGICESAVTVLGGNRPRGSELLWETDVCEIWVSDSCECSD